MRFLLLIIALALASEGAVWKTPEGRDQILRYCHTSSRLRREEVCDCVNKCYDTEYAVMAGETRDFLQCMSECACMRPHTLCDHLPPAIRNKGCLLLKASCSRPANELVRAHDPRSLHVRGVSTDDSRFSASMLTRLTEEGLCAYCKHVSSSVPGCMFCSLQK